MLGHHAGDSILSQVATVLARHVRSKDLLARVGGDEFGVLLPEVDPLEAREIAERLCTSVSRHSFEVDGIPVQTRVSLSVGLSCFPRDGSELDELLRSADKAMYRAKSTGKNRVMLAYS
jgi:diguanylate cyclase (GGDEF)-like protein